MVLVGSFLHTPVDCKSLGSDYAEHLSHSRAWTMLNISVILAMPATTEIAGEAKLLVAVHHAKLATSCAQGRASFVVAGKPAMR